MTYEEAKAAATGTEAERLNFILQQTEDDDEHEKAEAEMYEVHTDRKEDVGDEVLFFSDGSVRMSNGTTFTAAEWAAHLKEFDMCPECLDVDCEKKHF